ncbi:putative dehydrogenase [Geomicrobium halophilum]|uniref:Putative dehydrogenase n=1 Tax=Geomicrobium halophilum TaxID=549000 RepID=A0A841PUS2_9BACL|nr:Gfo/Idh/MocA family oxidoreductase [Geomicrobium halophilum]MBB6450886.1 putative dehydrogenase [Geomicrobium halophilum]
MGKLKLGFIGVGGIAQSRHLPNFSKLIDKVDIVGVCDTNQEVLHDVTDRYEIPYAFTDYQELLPLVDAVVICTPNKFHKEIAITALKSDVHVLCEKPLAICHSDGKEMVEAAESSGKTLMVAHHYRFMKDVQAAKRLIEKKEIGDPLVIRIQAMRRRKVPGWGVFTNKELQGGGSLIDYGSHYLDTALWLLDHPSPQEVVGTTYNRLSTSKEQVNQWGAFDASRFDVDDHVTAYIRFENNISFLFETSWAANISEDRQVLEVSGTNGGLSLFPLQMNYGRDGMLINSHAEWIAGEDQEAKSQALHFIDLCTLPKAQPIVTLENTLMTNQLIDAIYESSRNEKSVNLEHTTTRL